jgi:hypothetical protein
VNRRPGRLRLVHNAGRRRAAGGTNCTNPYGLTCAELRAEIRRRVRQGWAEWEIEHRFGYASKELTE